MQRWFKTLFAFSHDTLAAAVAFLLALWLRLGDGLAALPPDILAANLGLFTLTCAAIFLGSGLYRGIWAYASVRDLGAILKAVTLAIAVFVPLSFFLSRLEGIPRSTPVIVWFILLAFLSGSRLAYRLLREGRLTQLWDKAGAGRVPVLLYGAGDEADLFIRALAANPHAPYHVVGVIAENDKRVGRLIHAVPVLGTIEKLATIVQRLRAHSQAPSRLIVTPGAARLDQAATASLLEQSAALGLSLSRLPSMTDLRDENAASALSLKDRPIAIEDLLGRPETVLNREAIRRLVQGRRVLVTGAGGTIGSELTRQIAALGPTRLALVEFSEFNLYTIDAEIRGDFPALSFHPCLGDIRDIVRLKQIFAEETPDLVFHAAALKHVPIAEENVRETILTNVLGTRNVTDCAAESGAAAMVLISTDKAVNPSSVMGATKRVAEIYTQALDLAASGQRTRFLSVRFGNVLGSTGSVVPRFREQLAKGGPLTVTHPDMTRYFMTVREAVELVLQASALATGGQEQQRGTILVLDMGKPVKIVDLARQMIRLAGLRPDQDIQITFMGLRPGEKLHEQLHSQQENLHPSQADGVNLLTPRPVDAATVRHALEIMIEAARTGAEDSALRHLIHQLVPEFNGVAEIPRQAAAP